MMLQCKVPGTRKLENFGFLRIAGEVAMAPKCPQTIVPNANFCGSESRTSRIRSAQKIERKHPLSIHKTAINLLRKSRFGSPDSTKWFPFLPEVPAGLELPNASVYWSGAR